MVLALLLVPFTLTVGLAGRAAQDGASRQSLGPHRAQQKRSGFSQ